MATLTHSIQLRRLYCPHCRRVHRLRPLGYWRRYRSSIQEIQSALTHRLIRQRWRPDLPRSRQRQWWHRLGRMIRLLLGLSFAGSRIDGFERLIATNIIPVTAATDHDNRIIDHITYRVVALPGSF